MAETKGMNSFKHKWTFYLLWPNLAVAVVFLILIVSNQRISAREMVQTLVYSLVYANLIALFGVFFVEMLAERWGRRQLSLVPVFALCIFVIIPAGFLPAPIPPTPPVAQAAGVY